MTTQNTYKLRCQACQTKNNIPAEKINATAKCGKCGDSLDMRELRINEPFTITEATRELRMDGGAGAKDP